MNTSGSKQKNFPITNIGSVTLLMIFIVLCMITFAALSLSSAASDYQTARKSAIHAQEYYKASGRAEETLAKSIRYLKTVTFRLPILPDITKISNSIIKTIRILL